MNWKKITGIIIGIALVAATVIKLKSNKKIAEEKVYKFNKEQAIPVESDTISNADITAKYEYTGTFEPYKETKLSSEIQGKINEVLFETGSIVKRGQALIRLDNSLLKLQIQNTDIQIEGLESDVKRYRILANADAIQGVQLEKSELALKSAKIQKATLMEQLNKTIIFAPFNGVVTAKFIEVGGFASPGIPLLQLTDISNLKFTVNVSENDLFTFKTNQVYSITADAYEGLQFFGKITMIGSKANIGNSFPVEFSVKNTPDIKIKSGMFGKVHMKNEKPEKGILIPSSVILGNEEQARVYLIKNGKAELKNIVVSRKIKNMSVVVGGLNQGDIIVTNGFINLYNGANVSVQ